MLTRRLLGRLLISDSAVSIASDTDLPGNVGIGAAALDIPNVLVELVRHVCDSFEVSDIQHYSVCCLALVPRQSDSTLKCVADLASIPDRSSRVEVMFLAFEELFRVIDQLLHVTFYPEWMVAEATNLRSPNLLCLRPLQRWVLEWHMYS